MTRLSVATDVWLRELCEDREEHLAVLSLPSHARAIIAGQEPANPAFRFDDWFEFHAIPSVPSLN
jgi:hypothetical protein